MQQIAHLVSSAKAFLNRDAIFHRLLLNSSWLLAANALSFLLNFIQGILIARSLGPAQYGVFGLVITLVTTVNQLLDTRVWAAAIKYIVQYQEEQQPAKATAVIKLCYLVDLLTCGLGFGVVWLLAEWGAQMFIKEAAAAEWVRFYAFILLAGIPANTASAILRVGNRFDWLAYHNGFTSALKTSGVLWVFWNGAHPAHYLSVYLWTTALSVGVLFLLSRKVEVRLGFAPWRQSALALLRTDYRRILRFMVVTNLNALVRVIQRNADMLLVGYFLSPLEAGYFRIARSTTDLIGVPMEPFYTSSYPEFSRLWQQRRWEDLKKLLRKLTISAGTVALVGFLVVVLAGNVILSYTVGTEYLPAVPVMNWLAAGVGLAVASNFYHPLLLAMGKELSLLIAISLGVLVQLIVFAFFTPILGLTAAGIAYFVFYLVWISVTINTAKFLKSEIAS